MAKKSRHRQQERIKRAKARLSAALLYGSYGAPVVPLHRVKNGHCTCGDAHCAQPGKHPRTQLDIADATIDPDDIKRMWTKWPNAKIGMVMGWPGKLLALATDGEAGRRSLQAITVANGKLPSTVTIRDHDRRLYLFEVDEKPPRSRDVADGVRIVGDADLIIAPSILSGSDNKQRFASGRAPGEVKIAKVPRWLLEISAASESDRVAGESEARPAQSKPARPPSPEDCESRLVVTSAMDVPRKDVAWLWPERIALGKLSIIAGNPDLGKSQLAAFLAATVSTGREWPYHEGRAPLGTVIMLVAEDDAGDTVIPRLVAADADLSRIHFVDSNKIGCHRPLDLVPDAQMLEQVIRQFGDVRLIVIDPITAFLKSTAMQRAAAAQLQHLAANLNAAVVAISHFAKTARTNALTQVMGSLGLVAVARTLFIVTEEKGTDRRLFLPAKNNLSGARFGLAYRMEPKSISDGITAPAVVWDSARITTSADEALASAAGARKSQPALTDAVDFLRVLLGAGPIPAKVIKSEASDAGISTGSLRRAADILGVKARRIGGIAGRGRWIWELSHGSASAPPKMLDQYRAP